MIIIGIHHDKVVAVTGAASGIGKSTAAFYHNKGYYVIGMDKNQVQVPFSMLYCDIANENDVRDAFSEVSHRFGKIDYLINCAGIFNSGHRALVEGMNTESWDDILRVNLTGTMLVIREAIPLLAKSSDDKAIVNLTSDQAEHPKRKNAAYAVSKSGISCLTKICALELLDKGIRVNAVAPSSVKTNFILEIAGSYCEMERMYHEQDQKLPLGIIETSDVVNAIYYLGSEASRKLTGQILSINSGLYL